MALTFIPSITRVKIDPCAKNQGQMDQVRECRQMDATKSMIYLLRGRFLKFSPLFCRKVLARNMNWEDGYDNVTMVSLTRHIIMNRWEFYF